MSSTGRLSPVDSISGVANPASSALRWWSARHAVSPVTPDISTNASSMGSRP